MTQPAAADLDATRPMTTAGLQAKVSLRRVWFAAHPDKPVPEAREEVEGLFAAIEAEARVAALRERDARPPADLRATIEALWRREPFRDDRGEPVVRLVDLMPLADAAPSVSGERDARVAAPLTVERLAEALVRVGLIDPEGLGDAEYVRQLGLAEAGAILAALAEPAQEDAPRDLDALADA